MSALSDLQAQVALTIAVEEGAVSAIQTLTTELQAAVAAANTDAIVALTSQLATSANALNAAIVSSNTVVVGTVSSN